MSATLTKITLSDLDPLTLAAELRCRRLDAGLTLDEAAAHLGCGTTWLRIAEQGGMARSLTPSHVRRLSSRVRERTLH